MEVRFGVPESIAYSGGEEPPKILRDSLKLSELKPMAHDFYPVIARAIARLDNRDSGARRAVYDHARTVLARQLRQLNMRSSVRLQELAALEKAIRKVELEAPAEISAHQGSTNDQMKRDEQIRSAQHDD